MTLFSMMKANSTGSHRSSGPWTELSDRNACTDRVKSADPELGSHQESGRQSSGEHSSECYNPLTEGIADARSHDRQIISEKTLSRLQAYCQFWFIPDFFAVGIFAFGGVALRMAIGNALTGRIESGITSNEGPFFEALYTEPYLASNMVGSFAMALCVAFLSEITAISPALYKGITTGLCGSLTTLSSWMFDGFDRRFNNGNWYEMCIVVLLEFYLTWASFTMGLAAARLARELCSHPQVQQYLRLGQRQHAVKVVQAEPDSGAALEAGEVQSKREEDISAHTEASSSLNTLIDTETQGVRCSVPTSEPALTEGRLFDKESGLKASRWWWSCVAVVKQHEHLIWAGLFCLVAASLWIVLIAVPYIRYYENRTYRHTYHSVALAPFGAWLRWALTRFPSIKALWPEMNPQTLIANIAAVTIMSIITLSSDSTWVVGVDAGLCGSLSTVSTFMVELHTLYKEGGAWVSLRYALTTVLLSVTIIQVARTAAA